MKKILANLLVIIVMLQIVACGTSAGSETESATNVSEVEAELSIAYQYGLAYAPAIICQNNKLIEDAYEKATGKKVTVVWNLMSSGADINTGIASGSIDVGFMGIAPAITGVANGVGYKIFTNVSGQEHGMMTNKENINSLGDLIGSSEQVALVNIGSIQHIILGMALDANGYDAHSLDSNIVAMKHPDGMTALESGNVACHLTSNPYIYKEHENVSLHELVEVKNAWSTDNSFIVGVASEKLNSENPELYSALCLAIQEAMDSINSDFEAAAKITSEYDGNSFEDELTYMKAGSYSSATSGILNLAKFMYANQFIDKEIKEYSDLVFDNVTGD